MTADRDESTTTEPQPRARLPNRFAVAVLWVALIAILWGLDTLTKLQLRAINGFGSDGNERLIAAQATSAAAALAMVPLVISCVRRFPFARLGWRVVPVHVAGSFLFALGHYVLMVLLRAVVYPVVGLGYSLRQDHAANLLIEYQKDIKIYLGFVLIVAVTELVRRQTRPDSGSNAPAVSSATVRQQKLAVPTSTGERLVPVIDIDYLEAAGNYVRVYVDGRRYLLRSTLKALIDQLPDDEFVRAHRRYLVNIARIRELQTTGPRPALILNNDSEIPVSKGYRQQVRQAVARSYG